MNFSFYHFIYFYLFSSISKQDLEKKIYLKNKNKNEYLKDLIHNKFINIFDLNEIASKELKNSFFKMPTANIYDNFIMKGNLGIKFNFEDDKLIDINDINFSEWPN